MNDFLTKESSKSVHDQKGTTLAKVSSLSLSSAKSLLSYTLFSDIIMITIIYLNH
jgi:hypothetical protein